MTAKTRFNVTEACNVPRKHSLKNPFTGETLLDPDGKTYDFYIYGAKSDIGSDAHKARERRYGKGTVLADEEAANVGAEFLFRLTQGWSNNLHTLYDDEVGEVKFDRKTAMDLYKTEDWIAKQVMQFSLRDENYDPKRYAG